MTHRIALLLSLVYCFVLVACGGAGEGPGSLEGKGDIAGGPALTFSPVTVELLSEAGRLDRAGDCSLVRLRPAYPDNPYWTDGERVANYWVTVDPHSRLPRVLDGGTSLQFELEGGERFGDTLELRPGWQDLAAGLVDVWVTQKQLIRYFEIDRSTALVGRAFALSRGVDDDEHRMGYTGYTYGKPYIEKMDAMVIWLKKTNADPTPERGSVVTCQPIASLDALPYGEGGCYWFAPEASARYCF